MPPKNLLSVVESAVRAIGKAAAPAAAKGAVGAAASLPKQGYIATKWPQEAPLFSQQAPTRPFSTAAATNPLPKKKTLLFIGAGKMAIPLLTRIHKQYPNYEIIVCSPNAVEKGLPSDVRCYKNSTEIQEKIDYIIAAVKPQICAGTLPLYKKNVEEGRTVVISVMAGVTTATVEGLIGAPTIRVMPNTPAAVGAATTGVFVGKGVVPEQTKEAIGMFRAVGEVIEVSKEIDINSITACSGSGPAYFCYLAETINDAATNAGYSWLDEKKVFEIMNNVLGKIKKGQAVKDFYESHDRFKEINDLTSEGKATLSEFARKIFAELAITLPNEESATTEKGLLAIEMVEAYILRVTQAFIESAVNDSGEVKFAKEEANMLFLNTAKGTAQNALSDTNSTKSAADLREEVTSPRGTTYYGLKVLMDACDTLDNLCEGTIEAARARADELGKVSPQKKSSGLSGPDFVPHKPSASEVLVRAQEGKVA